MEKLRCSYGGKPAVQVYDFQYSDHNMTSSSRLCMGELFPHIMETCIHNKERNRQHLNKNRIV